MITVTEFAVPVVGALGVVLGLGLVLILKDSVTEILTFAKNLNLN